MGEAAQDAQAVPVASVYRCFDGEGQLLYIGFTAKRMRRFSEHRKNREWWWDVARIEVSHHATEAEARKVEWDLIRDLNPLHNRMRPSKAAEDEPATLYLKCRSCSCRFRPSAQPRRCAKTLCETCTEREHGGLQLPKRVRRK